MIPIKINIYIPCRTDTSTPLWTRHIDMWQILKNTQGMSDNRVGHISDTTQFHDRSVCATQFISNHLSFVSKYLKYQGRTTLKYAISIICKFVTTSACMQSKVKIQTFCVCIAINVQKLHFTKLTFTLFACIPSGLVWLVELKENWKFLERRVGESQREDEVRFVNS